MAVRAPNVALRDLSVELRNRQSVEHHRRNVVDFVAAMVKVQDDEVIFTTVDAWMLSQICADMFSGFREAFSISSHTLWLLIWMVVVVRLCSFLVTRATTSLSSILASIVFIELVKRFFPLAGVAGLHHRGCLDENGHAWVSVKWWAEKDSNLPLRVFSAALNHLSYQPVVPSAGLEPASPDFCHGALPIELSGHGGPGGHRTRDLWGFTPALYRIELPAPALCCSGVDGGTRTRVSDFADRSLNPSGTSTCTTRAPRCPSKGATTGGQQDGDGRSHGQIKNVEEMVGATGFEPV